MYLLCPHSDYTGSWHLNIRIGVTILMSLPLLILCIKFKNLGDVNERVPYLVLLNIIAISNIGTILSVFFNWGGTCIDSLG